MCLPSFQCLRVGAELHLANKLTENAMCGCTRYVRAPIALRYGTSGPKKVLHPFQENKKNLFSHQVIVRPSKMLIDKLYPHIKRFKIYSMYVFYEEKFLLESA